MTATRTHLRLAHVCALILSAGLAGCSAGSDRDRPNVLLITLDTVRADRVGCYGYDEARTPALDALAARGTVFEGAYTPAPMTLPAHASLMTGLLPPQHGARVNGEHKLAPDVPTLAEDLASHGYRTGAFTAAFVVDRRFGLARGFDHYDDDLSDAYEQEVEVDLSRYRPGDRVVDSALSWLDEGERDAPFFAWVHLFDAHYPWYSHDGTGCNGGSDPAAYDDEVAFVDDQVARLVAYLEERGLDDDTIVVAVADHGEGLGDHGDMEHAYLLNEEVLHVPWIMTGPGVSSGVRVPSLVSLEDFAPTVAELVGLPRRDVQGRSLAAALRGEAIPSGVCYAETDLPQSVYRWAPQRSLTTERWKYIRTPRPELYDRTADRRELANLVEVEAEVREAMDEHLSRLEAHLGERVFEPVELSGDDVAALAALGYAVDGHDDVEDTGVALADVKDRLPAKHLASRIRRERAARTLAGLEYVELSQELVRRSPETPAFHAELGRALFEVGALREAALELELVVQLCPDSAAAHYELGDTLQQMGRIEAARACFERSLTLDPTKPCTHVGMGNVWRAEGRPDLAAGRYARALTLAGDEYPEAHYNLALTFLDREQPQQAADHFLLAAEQRPGWALPQGALGHLYATWGKAPESIHHYELALQLAPDDAALHRELGMVLRAIGRDDEARAHRLESERLSANLVVAHAAGGTANR